MVLPERRRVSAQRINRSMLLPVDCSRDNGESQKGVTPVCLTLFRCDEAQLTPVDATSAKNAKESDQFGLQRMSSNGA